MKRVGIATVMLLCMVAATGAAEEDKGPFRIQAKTGIAGSIVSSYITPDVTVLYSPMLFSFGGGIKTFIGRTYGDVYLAPYGTVEFTWFYFNLGVSMQVKDSNENLAHPSTEEPPIYLSTGFYPRVKAGPGWIVFGGNVDVLATDSPVIEGDNALETIILTVFGAGFGLVKVEAGLGYRLAL